MTLELVLLSLLFIKHFVVDFPLQQPYHYLNKGTYGHPGGIQHAAYHGIGTAMCLTVFNPFLAAIAGIADFVVHYHVDYIKVKLNNRYNLKPDNSEKFWWLLGADQLAHALTYIAIVAWIF